jgi:signal transduction histidine kinase
MEDKNRLQQVLWNLLANAIKFTPKGGRVVVTASRINSHLEIMVSDNGAGIASDFSRMSSNVSGRPIARQLEGRRSR